MNWTSPAPRRKGFHACLKCSSLFSISDSYFCSFCREQFYFELASRPIFEQELDFGIRVYSPLLWRPSHWMSEALHAQKASFDDFFMKVLSEKLLTFRGRPGRSQALVPSPPRNPREPDHAYRWAQTLSDSGGGQVMPLLLRMKGGKQRKRGVAERREVRFRLEPDCASPKLKKIIFVDDVVTTGSTAIAAYMALGQPQGYEVWAMGCRPKSPLL